MEQGYGCDVMAVPLKRRKKTHKDTDNFLCHEAANINT
jgi:hypothetical protein